MKLLFTWLVSLISLCLSGQINRVADHLLLKKDSISCSLDGNVQVFYYYKSPAPKPRPLVVQLHSWSYSANDLQTIGLDTIAENRGYNYIFPNFRGVNNHAKACCSEFVIADIDEAIDWALKNLNVDKNRIYMVGYSGGGLATLAMFQKSRHKIRAFSSWAPISDLEVWYQQSLERKNRYANDIIRCLGTGSFDAQKARERSPLAMQTPVRKRKKSTVQIFAGIHDGYSSNAPVPISHSINFYNKLLADYHVKDTTKFVNRYDSGTMVKTQSIATSNPNNKIGDRVIHFQKSAKNIMLTVFEGGHDMLSRQALEYIEQKHGGK
jgi:pimeloyl-ACP methyl ester carboxylesterase